MSGSGELSGIVGYASDSYYPFVNDYLRIGYAFLIPLTLIALLMWGVILTALIRDKQYLDSNNLLVISFGIADILMLFVSFQTALIAHIQDGWGKGYQSCLLEVYFITVAFCASGLSTAIIGIDRVLVFNLGIETSWTKTSILLSIVWGKQLIFMYMLSPLIFHFYIKQGTSIIFPVFAILLNAPDSVLLVSGVFCVPNFTSSVPSTRYWLIFALFCIFLCMSTIVASYSAIFLKYLRAIRKRDDLLNDGVVSVGSVVPSSITAPIPAPALKLLKKCAAISGCFVLCWLPIDLTLLYMSITQREPSWHYILTVSLIYEMNPFLNPVILYFCDARIKISVNELTGLDRWIKPNFSFKKSGKKSVGGSLATSSLPGASQIGKNAMNQGSGGKDSIVLNSVS